MKKTFIAMLSVLLIFAVASSVNAGIQQTQAIDAKGYVGPNPTAIPSPSPTVTPSPIPTVAPTAAPTPKPTKPPETPAPTKAPQETTDKPGQKPDKETPPAPQKQVFKKMPLNKAIEPGKLVDYEVSGFGNDKNSNMEQYSITDILPEGLSLEKVLLPAFTKGTGLTYTIVYETNKTDRKTLKAGIPADKAYTAEMPKMESGEQMEYCSILFGQVVPGFGMGDKIIFSCRLSKNPPGKHILNKASLSYRCNGKDYMSKAETRGLQMNASGSWSVAGVKTGDTQSTLRYLLLAAAGIGAATMLLKKRQNRDRKRTRKAT